MNSTMSKDWDHMRVAVVGVALLALGAGCSGGAADAPVTQPEGAVAETHDAVISARPFGCNGARVALQASTGHFVVAEGGGGGDLHANRARIGPWETFTVHDLGGGRIALQSINGRFVVAENGGGDTVRADRPWLGPWETWTLARHWNGFAWSLQSIYGSYLVAEGGGGGNMNANRPGVGPWEAFTATCLD